MTRALWVFAEFCRFVMRRRRRFRVSGNSMTPAFVDGDLVLLASGAAMRRVRPGAVAIVRHPFKNLDVIKYVDAVEGDYVRLRSPFGDDSSQFGRAHVNTIVGVVTSNLSQRSRVWH